MELFHCDFFLLWCDWCANDILLLHTVCWRICSGSCTFPGGQMQLRAGPAYDCHHQLVLSMKEFRFTSPNSSPPTSPFSCFSSSLGSSALVSHASARLQLPLLSVFQGQDGCGKASIVCCVSSISIPATRWNGRPLLCLAMDPPPRPIGRSLRSSPSIRRSRSSRPPTGSPGGRGRVRSSCLMRVDEVEREREG